MCYMHFGFNLPQYRSLHIRKSLSPNHKTYVKYIAQVDSSTITMILYIFLQRKVSIVHFAWKIIRSILNWSVTKVLHTEVRLILRINN